MSNLQGLNGIYSCFFTDFFSVSVAVKMKKIPSNALVEIEGIAER